jgi:hypothetical protein
MIEVTRRAEEALAAEFALECAFGQITMRLTACFALDARERDVFFHIITMSWVFLRMPEACPVIKP